MTKGSPLWLILTFTLPLLLGNLLQQTYSLADTAIVARFLGADALAAVGATASVQFLVLGFCTGSCAGICIPLARDFGSGNMIAVRRGIYNGIWMVGAMATVMTALCVLLTPQILAILNTPANIYGDTRIYILIIFLGMPFTLCSAEYSARCILHRNAPLGLRGRSNRDDHLSGSERYRLYIFYC